MFWLYVFVSVDISPRFESLIGELPVIPTLHQVLVYIILILSSAYGMRPSFCVFAYSATPTDAISQNPISRPAVVFTGVFLRVSVPD
jgi:hypothetical protein